MASTINESSVERKLLKMSNTQDSIQSVTMWVLSHKSHHEQLVNIWFKTFKKAKSSQKLTMIYLCNDVVQTCKRKHAIVYKDAFKEILKDAMLLIRTSSIKANVERLLTIWKERKIYDEGFIQELSDILENAKNAATMDSRLLAEFQPDKLVKSLKAFKNTNFDAESKKKSIKNLQIDASNAEAVKQLKDRAHGKEFSQQFENSCLKLEECIETIERANKERTALLELLEQSEFFYEAQYSEAKLVTNAYKTFSGRVNNLSKKLEEVRKRLPSPPPSPPTTDVPSPGATPPRLREKFDNTDAVDMELSDEDEEVAEKNDEEPLSQTGSRPNSISRRKSKDEIPFTEILENIAMGKIPIPKTGSGASMGSEAYAAGDGGSTPVKDELDEGGSTPVMDEKPDSGPIEFLTKLISQTKHTGGAEGAGNLLKSLTELSGANSGPPPISEVDSSAIAGSWGAWKTTNQPSDGNQQPEVMSMPVPQMVPPPMPPVSAVPPMAPPMAPPPPLPGSTQSPIIPRPPIGGSVPQLSSSMLPPLNSSIPLSQQAGPGGNLGQHLPPPPPPPPASYGQQNFNPSGGAHPLPTSQTSPIGDVPQPSWHQNNRTGEHFPQQGMAPNMNHQVGQQADMDMSDGFGLPAQSRPDDNSDEQREFIEKLRHKSSSTPSTNASSNLRSLTQVPLIGNDGMENSGNGGGIVQSLTGTPNRPPRRPSAPWQEPHRQDEFYDEMQDYSSRQPSYENFYNAPYSDSYDRPPPKRPMRRPPRGYYHNQRY